MDPETLRLTITSLEKAAGVLARARAQGHARQRKGRLHRPSAHPHQEQPQQQQPHQEQQPGEQQQAGDPGLLPWEEGQHQHHHQNPAGSEDPSPQPPLHPGQPGQQQPQPPQQAAPPAAPPAAQPASPASGPEAAAGPQQAPAPGPQPDALSSGQGLGPVSALPNSSWVVEQWFARNASAVELEWPLAPQRCAPGCEARGNCNADTGECMCPYGYRGPTCEEVLLPACRWGGAGRRGATAPAVRV
jgi:hypothetical protein